MHTMQRPNAAPLGKTTIRPIATMWLRSVAICACLAAPGFARTVMASEAPKLTDAEILGIYIQVNGFDIETALLGRAQASSPAVRELATQVSSDHMAVRQGAYDLAAKCSVSPALPSGRNAVAVEHGRAMTKLMALKGNEFDKAYVQHEVAFHRAAVDAVRQALLPAAACPALKAHFTEILPALEHHYSETASLARELTAR
ncbi:MAG: DUF4142 domain-containing protein [bacterium]